MDKSQTLPYYVGPKLPEKMITMTPRILAAKEAYKKKIKIKIVSQPNMVKLIKNWVFRVIVYNAFFLNEYTEECTYMITNQNKQRWENREKM